MAISTTSVSTGRSCCMIHAPFFPLARLGFLSRRTRPPVDPGAGRPLHGSAIPPYLRHLWSNDAHIPFDEIRVPKGSGAMLQPLQRFLGHLSLRQQRPTSLGEWDAQSPCRWDAA
jgi:hypothetical protein